MNTVKKLKKQVVSAVLQNKKLKEKVISVVMKHEDLQEEVMGALTKYEKQKEQKLKDSFIWGCHELDRHFGMYTEAVHECISEVCNSDEEAKKFLSYIEQNDKWLFESIDRKGILLDVIEMHNADADEDGSW